MATRRTGGGLYPLHHRVVYEIKCQNGHYPVFVLTKTETLANAYNEYYAYNIDMETGVNDSRDLRAPTEAHRQ